MSEISDLQSARALSAKPRFDRAAWVAEVRALAKLAGPLAFTQLMQIAVMTTDLIMLGRLGKEAIAAAALGNAVFFFTWLIAAGPASAVSPMIAHILGADPSDTANVRGVTRMGLWAVWALCVPLAGLLLATEPILLAFHQAPELAHLASLFTLPLCVGLFFNMGFNVMRNYTTALGHPKLSLIVMAGTVLFNGVADYALIFGHFGFPRLEIVGSAIATTASFAFSLLTMIGVVRFTPALEHYHPFRDFGSADWPKLVELFRLGMPIGLTMVFEAMLFNCSMLVMGMFGTDFVAAHQIALNVPSITFMVPLGIAIAATVRVGLAAGANDIAGVRRAGYTAMAMGAAFMALCGIVIALFPKAIAGLYFGSDAADPKVISLAATFLYAAAAFQVFDAVQVVAAFSLRGLKDARVPMWLAGVSYWLIGAPVGLILAFRLEMRGLGIWIGLATSLAAATVFLSLRFRYLTR